MYCYNCGKEVLNSDKFCYSCGAKLPVIKQGERILSSDDEDVFKETEPVSDTGIISDKKSLEKNTTSKKEKVNRPKDANGLKKTYQDVFQKAESALSQENTQRNHIKSFADKLQARAVMNKLASIPVSEVNRDKQGIRVKLLSEHGYQSIADLMGVRSFQLSSLRGIGEKSAETICTVVSEIVKDAQETTRISINLDNKNDESTSLVQAVSCYLHNTSIFDELKELQGFYKNNIETNISDLLPSANGFRWLFSSAEKKQKSVDAYQVLQSPDKKKYIDEVNTAINSLWQFNQMNAEESWDDFKKNSARFYAVLETITPHIMGDSGTGYGLPEDLAREIQDEVYFPDGLLCTLRSYQEWGVRYILHQKRVLLGDEMGLGKTIQAIATMVSLKNTGATHFIVVCPASVLSNWCREINKHSRLSVTKIHGSSKHMALRSWIRTGGVAVTTYETTGIFNFSDDWMFDLCVVDEAHYIKNVDARRSRNVRFLCKHAERLLFMTGTAIENKVDEMVSLISVLQPEVANRITGKAMKSYASEFRKTIIPVYYRRKREDVLSELPDLIENKEWCTLGQMEMDEYRRTLDSRNFAAVRRVSWNVDDLSQSSKANRLLELVDEAKQEDRKVIVFSFFLDTIDKVMRLLGNQCVGPINGSVSPQKRQEIIDQFEAAPSGTVLAAQIQSGGTGLNIQAASVVVICEPQFKPSIENQAISRAYRMGQTRNVLVYRLLCENTVDERITNILEEKQEIFDAFADKSEAAASEKLEISSGAFKDIIQQEIDRINKEQGKTVDVPLKSEDDQPDQELEETRTNQTRKEYQAMPDLINNSPINETKEEDIFSDSQWDLFTYVESREEKVIDQIDKYMASRSAFSKKEITQWLQADGFSEDEIETGYKQYGIDWKNSAAERADDYLTQHDYSRNNLKKKLEADGFSKEEIEYAVNVTIGDSELTNVPEYLKTDFAPPELFQYYTDKEINRQIRTGAIKTEKQPIAGSIQIGQANRKNGLPYARVYNDPKTGRTYTVLTGY